MCDPVTISSPTSVDCWAEGPFGAAVVGAVGCVPVEPGGVVLGDDWSAAQTGAAYIANAKLEQSDVVAKNALRTFM
jgi:hypothetical protein